MRRRFKSFGSIGGLVQGGPVCHSVLRESSRMQCGDRISPSLCPSLILPKSGPGLSPKLAFEPGKRARNPCCSNGASMRRRFRPVGFFSATNRRKARTLPFLVRSASSRSQCCCPASHQRAVHGVAARADLAAVGSKCEVCCKEFWSTKRLKLHLRKHPACLSATEAADLSPRPALRGAHSFAWPPAMPVHGPKPFGPPTILIQRLRQHRRVTCADSVGRCARKSTNDPPPRASRHMLKPCFTLLCGSGPEMMTFRLLCSTEVLGLPMSHVV